MRIRDFQNMMRQIYFDRDLKRGAVRTYNWLVEEVGELGEAMEDQNVKDMEREFADVLAWLASLANVVSIDLEKAAKRKYDNRCPKCGSSPCRCPF